MATKTRLRVRPEGSTPSVSFQEITTLKSDTSGEHFFFAGAPAVSGDVSAVRKSKLVGRYPNNSGGTRFELQVDNHHTAADGSLRFAGISGKIPAGYTAMDKIGIGYSDDFSFSSAPNWSTITSSYATTFTCTISIYEPKKVLAYFKGTPNLGDSWTITISDGLGADLVYTQEMDTPDFGSGVNLRIYTAFNMQRRITGDASGRYESIKNSGFKITDVPAGNDPVLRNATTGAELSGYERTNVKVTQNASSNIGIGNYHGSAASSAPFVPNAYQSLSGYGGQGGAMAIWPRYKSGNPVDFTATFAITQAGRTLTYDGVTSNLVGGGKILNFDNQTTNFNAPIKVIGRTSGAIGVVVSITDSGSTGKILLRYITGTFQDNEIVDAWVSGSASAANGSAQVNGTVAHAKVYGGTSGASADLLDTLINRDGNGNDLGTGTLAVRNITGTFQDNEALTDDFGHAVTCNGTISGLSDWRIATSDADTTGALTGTLPTIDTPANRVTWTATYTTGTDLANLGDWLDGTQTREKIKKVPFKDGGGNDHPHLYAFMGPKWDNTGAVFDRWLTVNNDKCRANSKEYWYDVTSISDGTTNFIASDLADYQNLMHTPFASWEWEQDKPFAMCDPLSFMKAKHIWTWERFPSRDYRAVLYHKTQGVDSSQDAHQVFNQTLYDARGGYSMSKPGLPLYAGPIKFDGSGGASVEIGVYSAWEHAFWSSDTFLMWEQFKSLATNCWSAWPFYMRDEEATAVSGSDWADASPHPYMRYGWHPESSYNAVGDKVLMAQHLYPSSFTLAGGHKTFAMWTGHAVGGYAALRLPKYSHTPPHPARSAYLVRPEWRYADKVEQYAFTHVSANDNQNSGTNAIKTAGAAGDADHVMAIVGSNGNRDLSWPWRSAVMAAATQCDRHPRRDIWVRASNDYRLHYREIADTTWNGFIDTRGPMNSNRRTLPTMKTGDRFYAGALQADLPCRCGIDNFKGSYCGLVAVAATELDVVDCRADLAVNAVGWLKMVHDLPLANWWHFIGVGYFPICTLDYGVDSGGIFRSNDGIVDGENFNDWRTYIATLNASDVKFNWIRTQQYVTSPQKDFYEGPNGGFPYDGEGLLNTNYNRIRFYVTFYQGLARVLTDSTQRTQAEEIVDLCETAMPYDDIDIGNRGGVGTDASYTKVWGTWAARKPEDINTYW